MPTDDTHKITTNPGNNQIVSDASGAKIQIATHGKVVKRGLYKVDVVFVFDTTGSMTDKINGLLRTCGEFVREANALDLDPQFALIAFGDLMIQGGGDRIDLVVPLTDDIERISHGLEHIPRNNGFGNIGESAFEATVSAYKLPYRDMAVKVLIVITDEPAHQHTHKAETMIAELGKREFLVFTVATNDWYYQDMAVKNGGVWKPISASTNLSEILDMFRDLAKKVAKVASEVQRLASGSVSEYLRLNPPKNS